MPTRAQDVQRGEAREGFVWQQINEAHEIIRKDKDPDIQPTIQLKEGWKNGNIHVGTGAPSPDLGHTWDIYLDTTTIGSGWQAVTAIYVRRPT